MPITSHDEEQDEHEDGDADDFAEGGSDDDEIVTIPCPHCRKPIWEEAIACEHCGNYLSTEDQPWRRPWWMIAGVAICLFCIYWWLRR